MSLADISKDIQKKKHEKEKRLSQFKHDDSSSESTSESTATTTTGNPIGRPIKINNDLLLLQEYAKHSLDAKRIRRGITLDMVWKEQISSLENKTDFELTNRITSLHADVMSYLSYLATIYVNIIQVNLCVKKKKLERADLLACCKMPDEEKIIAPSILTEDAIRKWQATIQGPSRYIQLVIGQLKLYLEHNYAFEDTQDRTSPKDCMKKLDQYLWTIWKNIHSEYECICLAPAVDVQHAAKYFQDNIRHRFVGGMKHTISSYTILWQKNTDPKIKEEIRACMETIIRNNSVYSSEPNYDDAYHYLYDATAVAFAPEVSLVESIQELPPSQRDKSKLATISQTDKIIRHYGFQPHAILKIITYRFGHVKHVRFRRVVKAGTWFRTLDPEDFKASIQKDSLNDEEKSDEEESYGEDKEPNTRDMAYVENVDEDENNNDDDNDS